MVKKEFLTILQGFDLHIAEGYTVSVACSQFLVLYECFMPGLNKVPSIF